jgi:hypothetical protein
LVLGKNHIPIWDRGVKPGQFGMAIPFNSHRTGCEVSNYELPVHHDNHCFWHLIVELIDLSVGVSEDFLQVFQGVYVRPAIGNGLIIVIRTSCASSRLISSSRLHASLLCAHTLVPICLFRARFVHMGAQSRPVRAFFCRSRDSVDRRLGACRWFISLHRM